MFRMKYKVLVAGCWSFVAGFWFLVATRTASHSDEARGGVVQFATRFAGCELSCTLERAPIARPRERSPSTNRLEQARESAGENIGGAGIHVEERARTDHS